MGPHIPLQRRRFNVHPIQQKYFFLSLVPLFVFALILILLVLFPLNAALRGPFPDPDRPSTLWQIHALMDVRIWLALLISMLASCVLSYFVTNKFAGHLYRIEQILHRSKEGDLPPAVRIRRDDDLQELAALLDSNFKATTSALTAIKTQQALAVRALDAVQGKVKAGSHGEMILAELERIGRNLREVENILAHFKLPTGHAPPPDSPQEQ
ncbi:MAG: hypothetical protein ACE5IQ_00820 [Candidatus Methylomirabilales bacterium]